MVDVVKDKEIIKRDGTHIKNNLIINLTKYLIEDELTEVIKDKKD